MNILGIAGLFLLLQTPAPSIEGLIVRSGTNEPIAGARITAGVLTVVTDAQGRFALKDLEPGTYRLTAQRNGFARQEYGERAPGKGGTAVTVVAGQTVKDIVLRLVPGGAVSGRVFDPVGDPVAGITVQLLKPFYDETGRRRFRAERSERTNDRGEYRFYWVNPGRYYVNASVASSPRSDYQIIEPGYALTFYPGTTDASTASAVEVRSGVELATIDFALIRQQLFRVRGRVIDVRTGRTPQQVQISISSRNPQDDAEQQQTADSYSSATGLFEVRDVAPGMYWLGAMGGLDLLTPSLSIADILKNVAVTPVDVSNSDVDNIVLAFTPGFSIPGRISIENGASMPAPRQPEDLHVGLQPLGRQPFMGGLPQSIKPDGTFLLDGVHPGNYRLHLDPLPEGFYIKSALFGQTDVLESMMVSGPVSGGLDIVLAGNAGQLEVATLDKDRKPVSGIEVVLIPDRLRARRDLYKRGITEQNGRVTIPTIPPGEYKVFAWEDIEPFAYNDPDVLRRYEEVGVSVKVSESAKVAIEARIIPAGQ
jgi:hypothetical protein